MGLPSEFSGTADQYCFLALLLLITGKMFWIVVVSLEKRPCRYHFCQPVSTNGASPYSLDSRVSVG